MSEPEVVISYQLHLRSGCPYCESRGKIKSIRTVTIDLQRRVLQNLKEIRNREGIEEEIYLKVTLHPSCLSQVKEDALVLLDIERNYGARLSFATNPAFHIESFEIIQIKD